MRSPVGRSPARHGLIARGLFALAVFGVSAPACRHGYEVLGSDDGNSSTDALTGVGGTLADGGSAGDPSTSLSGGADSSVDSGGAGPGGSGATGTSGVQNTGGGGTVLAGASATAGTDGSTGAVGAADATTTSGTSATTAGAGGTDGSGATLGGASATTTGSTSTTGAATTGGAGSGADLTSGYWLLDAVDTAGTDWAPSTLVVTSSAANPDGTTDLTYRIDWFETAADFGVLPGGEEAGNGNFDPVSNRLSLTQTGGFSSDVLDVYQAAFDASSDTLSGSWDTGTPGTFTGVRRLDGALLPPPAAVASSTQSGTSASNAVDADMFSNWSSGNGSTVGETLTLTLVSPARLRGLRLMAVPAGSAGIPARLQVSSRDSGGNEVDLRDVVVPSDPMWNPIPVDVDAAVAEVRLEITEVEPANANRVVIHGVELFGTP